MPRSAAPDPSDGEGRVLSLHRKPEVPGEHGLPKAEIAEVLVTARGVEGDFNRYRHEVQRDEPGQALLLMPIEMIRTLNEEGWPIRPGDLGENVTTERIPYDRFRVGGRVRVGEVLAEVSKPCTPCTNLELLPYVGHARGPEFIRTMVGRRGWYAWVRSEGRVRRGDPIQLLPAK